jgi:CHAT domain
MMHALLKLGCKVNTKLNIPKFDIMLTITVQDPWIIEETTHESRLRWLFKDYPTKHPFDCTKAQIVATQLGDYGRQLIDAIHLGEVLKQNVAFADEELVYVDIQGSMKFQKLHWETMESAFEGAREPRWPGILIRRTMITNPDDYVQGSSLYGATLKRPFNLLLVVARQPNSDDIDPFLSSGVLTKLCRRLCARLGEQRTKPNLEIARPGTWKAFERLLDLRTRQWHEKGGSGPWFDIVHFDLHGTIKNSEAYIHFLSGSGEWIFKQKSANVGNALARNHVTTVFLNACESGYLGEEPSACFAKGLTDSGVSNVLAMSYSLTNTAASILVSTFYTYLLTTKLDFWAASGAARQALRDSTLRDCRFGRKVELQDSIIPIIFTSGPAADKSWTHDYALQLPLNIECIREHEGVPTILVNEIFAGHTTPPITGRESDVLKMEWMVSDEESVQQTPSKKGKTILLKGPAGVGKSEFARYLASWWVETNFVKSAVYLDVSRPTFEYELATASARRDESSSDGSVSSTDRTLYVLDHVDSKTLPTSGTTFDEEGKGRFKTAVAALAGTDNIVLLISRKDEEWLRVRIRQRHQLQNLDPYSATILASKIYDELPINSILETRDEASALETLLCRLDYNPLAIEVFLYALMERSSSIDDCKPSSLLHQLLYLPDFIPMFRNPHKQVQECRDFVKELITQQSQKANIILSRLALTSGWFDEDWYRLTYLSGGLDIGLDDATITVFVKKFLLTSGWVTKRSESYQLYRNNQAQSGEKLLVNGYHMHALLVNAVRERFFSALRPLGTRSEFTQGMWWHFTELMIRKAGVYNQSDPGTVEGLRHQALTEAEAFSFLTAFEVCLQDALEPIVSGPNKQMWGAHGLWGVLKHLHKCSKKITRESQTAPQTIALSLPMILPRMELVQNYLFLRLAIGRLDWKQETRITNLEYCMLVTRMLAEHYYVRNPMRSGQYIALCLALICRHAKRITTFNWELQNIFAWLLITLSYCYIYTHSSFSQPEKILRVALQACRLMEQRTVIEDSDTVPPTSRTFDLAQLSRQDLENSPYRRTLAARMYEIATLRLCAFKALRMVHQTVGEAELAKYFETLEIHTQVFFFQFFPANALHELPRLGERYGDTNVLYVFP